MNIKRRTEPAVTVTVDKTADVYLDITIGNAQIGGSVVRFNGNTTIIGKGAITNLNLGLGQALVGQTIQVVTNVLDVNSVTNGIVVTNYFHNSNPATFPYNDTVDNDGDIFSLTTQFTFA
jgi:hypothetical protein